MLETLTYYLQACTIQGNHSTLFREPSMLERIGTELLPTSFQARPAFIRNHRRGSLEMIHPVVLVQVPVALLKTPWIKI